MANEDQIQYWNEKGGPRWATVHEKLDASIKHLGIAMLDRAQLRTGESVIDIGCGCGPTTFEAGRRVGEKGYALGVDIARPLLAIARERLARERMRQVDFQEVDAQTMRQHPAAFDTAVSRFGVMFFQDPAAAFANIRATLKPGGRLAFVCWRNVKENPWVLAPMMATAQHMQLPEPPAPDQPGPFSFADEQRVSGILQKAGYQKIAIEAFDAIGPAEVFGTANDTADFFMAIGPVASMLDEAAPELRAKVRGSIVDALRGYESGGALKLGQAVWMVTARNS